MKAIPLTTPVRAHGDEIGVLELREPTGKDVRELGFPYNAGTEGGLKLDAGVIARYVSRLGGIPPSAVDEMSPVDLNTVSWVIAGFFLGTSTPSGS